MEIIKKGFENDRLGIELDVYVIDGKGWFKAKDVSDFLGYSEAKDMTRIISFEENINRHIVPNVVNPKGTLFISEFGLYEVICKINKTDLNRFNKAREFQKWVFGKVLPSLRENGAYVDEKFEDKKLQERYLKILNLTMSLCRSKEHALSSISKEIFNGNRAALKRKLVEDGYISEDMTTILKGHFKDHSGVIRPILLQKNTQIMVDGEIKTRHNITATGYGFAHFMYKYNNVEIK